MSVEMTHPARPFIYEDLEAMPDDGYRREIIGGSLLVTPAPGGRHQRVALNLALVLRAAEVDEAMVMVGPYDWRLPDGGSVQPDVVVIRRSDFDPAGPLPATAVPWLVVEVLSPSNPAQDRMLKRELYERLGVPAYWIVDPSGPVLTVLRLVNGHYEVEFEGSETYPVEWPFPAELSISDLAK
jgi:Uma2 family endonuclease